MDKEKKIEKQLERDLGFNKCNTIESHPEDKGFFPNVKLDNFKAECKNIYEDSFACEGRFNKEKGNLSKTNCEKTS